MSNFDTLFFEQHISHDETIERVFHQHIFVMIEDFIVWIFFGLCVPAFFWYFNIFEIQAQINALYVYGYMFLIYFILLYKLFDWYLDVWIATGETLVQLRWKWFTPQLFYINYNKIEGIEVRTRSWFHSLLHIADVSINLYGEESYTLYNAAKPRELVQFLQDVINPKAKDAADKEPFEVLVDALSGMVKDHLVTHGKSYISEDYIQKLDTTLSQGLPIDLRSDEEKIVISNWKKRVRSKKSEAKSE